jgi:pimeloyl-ACP methyl ester carboxylesterase
MNTRSSVLGIALAAGFAAICGAASAQTRACAPRSDSEGKRFEEAGFVVLGGIEQWVTIRGDDAVKPILLHVHGGPGIAFSAFVAEFAPYEAAFTVVQWDQRGAGCTFGRHGQDTPDVTLDRLARDGIELAEFLERRLPDASIIVLGHSFGSIVATEMVRRAPEHFAAYVGTGQFASFARTVDAQIAYMRERAADGDAQSIAELDELGTLDSRTLAKFGAVNRLLATRGPAVDAAFLQRLQARAAEVMGSKELADWHEARSAAAARLVPELVGVDLFSHRLEVPFVVIQGRDDPNTPTNLARAFFAHVEGRDKKIVVIEGAGHFPHLTHTEEFLAALVGAVRPTDAGQRRAE